MQRARQSRQGQRGFTLVELMYATGYFMLGLAALASFQIFAASGSQRAGDITMATNLCASTIETLRVNPIQSVLGAAQPLVSTYDRYGNLTSAVAFYTVNVSSPTVSPAYFTVTATCTQTSGLSYYEVLVNTSWKAQVTDSYIHNITMQTRIPTE